MSLLPSPLPRPMAELLVPDGSTLADCWVVCLGEPELLHTTSDGRPVYGDVARWTPILPCADRQAAQEFAERMGVASLGHTPNMGWAWYSVSDDCPELWELYGYSDDHDERPEVAIVPLAALVAGEPVEQADAVQRARQERAARVQDIADAEQDAADRADDLDGDR